MSGILGDTYSLGSAYVISFFGSPNTFRHEPYQRPGKEKTRTAEAIPHAGSAAVFQRWIRSTAV